MVIELTLKIQEFIRKIEDEISHKISIVSVSKLPVGNSTAAISMSPDSVVIFLNSSKTMSTRELEHTIAHEVTHALLVYKRKYTNPEPKKGLSNEEIAGVSILKSMVDDIVIDTIIQKEGFRLYSDGYLEHIQELIAIMDRGTDLEQLYPGNEKVKYIFLITRYVMNWGYLKYSKLDDNEKGIFNKFLLSFKKVFPEQYKKAKLIIELMLKNNIFTTEGRNIVLSEVLKIWRYDALVQLMTY